MVQLSYPPANGPLTLYFLSDESDRPENRDLFVWAKTPADAVTFCVAIIKSVRGEATANQKTSRRCLNKRMPPVPSNGTARKA